MVVLQLYYIGTLGRGLVGAGACWLRPSLGGRVIVGGHGCRAALRFDVGAGEDQDRVPALCWLPGLHGEPCWAGFVASSGSRTF